ncbi:MAG: type I secretion system permease/ATPase [Aquidulcibacter sp.]|jgi:PrtD family type I secretion system ABC transporter|uniref:type I secretion system permease/ATPase n=1 Tax=Aquidulcibacter sp. TaxID=2052990 RepID=UPI0022BF2957|nr:type I secretion system permease/ATPase [Aquidulcibacter sp.]
MPNLEWDVFIKDASNIIFDTNQLTFVPRRINKPAKHRLDHRILAPLVFHFAAMKVFSSMKKQSNNSKKQSLLELTLRLGRPAIVSAAIFSLGVNILFLALPLYTTQVYSRVLSSGSLQTLFVITIITIFAFIVSEILDFLQSRILAGFGTMLDQRVSGHVFAALFDGIVRRDAQAGAQALRDLDSFRQTITGPSIAVLFDVPWTPVYIIILLIIDPIVGLVCIIGALILLGLAILQDRLARPLILEANKEAVKGYAFTEAALRNAEVVRGMGMLGAIGEQWAKHRQNGMQHGTEASEVADRFGGAIKFFRNVIQVMIIGVGAVLILDNQISSGLLFANMILSSRALAPIDRIVSTWPTFVAAGNSFQRLNELLENYTPAQTATDLPRPAGRVTVEGLNYLLPDSGRLLLTNINFAVEPGEFLGVIGPSGAGKSTLARLLLGIHQPLNGAVRLDGSNVFGWSRNHFGRYIGYLPQDTELFAGTVRENIARFQTDVTDEEVIDAAKKANAHELIVRLPQGYDTELGAGGAVLSVGQRQRVGLARAMLRSPALVILDEPNANLDGEGEQALLMALREMKKAKQTVVVVSHKPSMLQDADKLLLLRDGKIELFGPRQAVLDRIQQIQAPKPPIPATEKLAKEAQS